MFHFQEAARYIAKIEERFGPFNYAPPKTKLLRGKLDIEQYDQMIPGFISPWLRRRPLELQSPEESPRNNNGNDTNIVVMDDVANTTQNVTEESINKAKILRIDAAFMEKVTFLRGLVCDLKATLIAQRTRMAELQTKNASLEQEIYVEKQLNAKIKANFDAQTSQLSQLRKEIDALKHEKEVQDSAHGKLIAEYEAQKG